MTDRRRFAMSPSALNTFKQCRRQFVARYGTKEIQFEQTRKAREGELVHARIEEFIKGQEITPHHYAVKIVDHIRAKGIVLEYAELNTGVDAKGEPVGYADSSAVLRAKLDYVAITNVNIAYLVDWKNGRYRTNDLLQLYVGAMCLFALLPALHTVIPRYAWLHYEELAPKRFTLQREETMDMFHSFQRSIIYAAQALLDQQLSTAFDAPATKNNLCKWCPLYELCPEGQGKKPEKSMS